MNNKNRLFLVVMAVAALTVAVAPILSHQRADIALLKEAMLDMQKLLKNPEKLAELSKISILEA